MEIDSGTSARPVVIKIDYNQRPKSDTNRPQGSTIRCCVQNQSCALKPMPPSRCLFLRPPHRLKRSQLLPFFCKQCYAFLIVLNVVFFLSNQSIACSTPAPPPGPRFFLGAFFQEGPVNVRCVNSVMRIKIVPCASFPVPVPLSRLIPRGAAEDALHYRQLRRPRLWHQEGRHRHGRGVAEGSHPKDFMHSKGK